MKQDLVWVDASTLTVEGRGWFDPNARWVRLPSSARGVVRDPVWDLSRHSAGIAVRFRTQAGPISVRWTLLSDSLEMRHMPSTGVSGIDVYCRDGRGEWRFVANLPPSKGKSAGNAVLPGSGIVEVQLLLPLYNGVVSLEVAARSGATLLPAPARPAQRDRPWVVYGTSIAQGGCASRPGMAWPTILARRIDRPVINLGFSGNGKLDPEMGPLLAQIDPVLYVIDCIPNCGQFLKPEIEQRIEGLVNAIRSCRNTPILFVGRSVLDDRQRPDDRSVWQEAIVKRLARQGVFGLYCVEGTRLNGSDGDATVDGVHPNDLGMLRHAQTLEPLVRRLAKG